MKWFISQPGTPGLWAHDSHQAQKTDERNNHFQPPLFSSYGSFQGIPVALSILKPFQRKAFLSYISTMLTLNALDFKNNSNTESNLILLVLIPAHQYMKWNYIVFQQNVFFEERIIKGEKHRGNYLIERTKQSRYGNRIARRRLLAEKTLVEFETFRAEGDAILVSLTFLPAVCIGVIMAIK